jgi:pimeloyl-ACP methyl ester carboxylesterase
MLSSPQLFVIIIVVIIIIMVIFRMVRKWWTQSDSTTLLKAQDLLLSSMVKSSFTSSSTNGMNSVTFHNPRPSSPSSSSSTKSKTVILAHGFGSGLGFFHANVDLLFQHDALIAKVVLVDWLGMGGSERPSCRSRPRRGWTERSTSTSWCDSRFTTSQACRFFVDPFHSWMQETVLSDKHDKEDEIVLMGHSLGGYLAARYVLEYPDTVHRLVLASPVGFPNKPKNALVGSQLPTSYRVVDALWSSNFTPQQVVRAMGATRGRQRTQQALRARIPHLSPRDAILLADYLYHITVAAPSGEFAMNSLLEPVVSAEMMGVFAREPLQDLLPAITSSTLAQVKVLYGDQDWMRPNEPSARKTLQDLQQRTGIATSVEVLPNAGHHLYLDNPLEFTKHVMQ